MPKNQIQKSLQDYLSKMKKPTPQTPQNQLPPTPRSLSSSTSWILRGCKHPRTPSFSSSHHSNRKGTMEASPHHGAATLSDVDRFLLENFKTLYQNAEEEVEEGEEEKEEAAEIKRSIEDKNEEKPVEIFLDSARRRTTHSSGKNQNHRFFEAPAASFCSLVEAATTSLTTSGEDISSSSTTTISTSPVNDLTRRANDHNHDDAERELSPDDFITVLTYSLNPYDDFKKSMQEMIDARCEHMGKINWEFMEELLFCFLNLNDKKSHRFILKAFVDLIVVLRENPGSVPAKPRSVPSKVGRRWRRNN